ncbi:Unknown protein, partial [Striga hermonthica]
NMISTELPVSINTLFTSKPVTSVVITKASLWGNTTPSTSSARKLISSTPGVIPTSSLFLFIARTCPLLALFESPSVVHQKSYILFLSSQGLHSPAFLDRYSPSSPTSTISSTSSPFSCIILLLIIISITLFPRSFPTSPFLLALPVMLHELLKMARSPARIRRSISSLSSPLHSTIHLGLQLTQLIRNPLHLLVLQGSSSSITGHVLLRVMVGTRHRGWCSNCPRKAICDLLYRMCSRIGHHLLHLLSSHHHLFTRALDLHSGWCRSLHHDSCRLHSDRIWLLRGWNHCHHQCASLLSMARTSFSSRNH